MLHLLMELWLIVMFAVSMATSSSYGYFLDSSCTTVESLVLEDFCIETKKCERVSYTANGANFPGTVYRSPICAQSDEAIQGLFPKGTKLFVSANYKGQNCTGEFTTPTNVYIADNKCHQNGYNHGYRLEVEISGVVSLHRYYEHDCSGLDVSGVYDKYGKEKIGACGFRAKRYFLVGTGDAISSTNSNSSAPSLANTNSTDVPGSQSTSVPTLKSEACPRFGLCGIMALMFACSIGWVSI